MKNNINLYKNGRLLQVAEVELIEHDNRFVGGIKSTYWQYELDAYFMSVNKDDVLQLDVGNKITCCHSDFLSIIRNSLSQLVLENKWRVK
jgi:hypothetical protein